MRTSSRDDRITYGLDSLRRRDCQTLGELEGQLRRTRFGVMKHPNVLADAHLVTTRKLGRFEHHHLDALPLQEMVGRWVDPFLQPRARPLSNLKTTPGASGMKLTVEHSSLTPAQAGVREGWARFAAGLETWLETGRTHRFALETA